MKSGDTRRSDDRGQEKGSEKEGKVLNCSPRVILCFVRQKSKFYKEKLPKPLSYLPQFRNKNLRVKGRNLFGWFSGV